MKYYTISADYLSTGIKDINGNELSFDELGLTKEIWDELQEWVQHYSPIIQMDEEERNSNINLINQLDEQGLELCSRIQKQFKEQIKIEYYSEGLLKKILFQNPE